MEAIHIRPSTLAIEGASLVAKWIGCSVLLNDQEMRLLIEHLGDFYIFQADRIVKKGFAAYSKEEFLTFYLSYVQNLQEGKLTDPKQVREYFNVVWTNSLEALYSIDVGQDREIIKACRPVIVVQPHRLSYSDDDGKFRSMGMNQDYISWGLYISYPQLFQDPKTCVAEKVTLDPKFPNSELFQKIQKWVRYNTVPTTFQVTDKVVTAPIRLGKECFGWINNHPDLIKKGFRVIKK